jgi:hypothetical protein
MAKTVSHITLQGDILTIYYTDSEDPSVDERAAIIRWKKHPKVIKLVQGFFQLIGEYFLTENKSLDALADEQIDDLLRRLVQEEPPAS